MNIKENEYNFLSNVYLDMCGEDDMMNLEYHHRKRLDDYFISHLTNKKIRMSNRLATLLFFIVSSENADVAVENKTYLNNKQHQDLTDKLKNYLGVS